MKDVCETEFERTKEVFARGYRLTDGDIFTVAEKQLFEVFAMSNRNHIFVPIKRHRRITWYKPATWFRWLWDIQYTEL